MQKNQGLKLFNSGKSQRAKSKASAAAKLVDNAELSPEGTVSKNDTAVNFGRPVEIDPNHRFGKSSGSR